MRSPTGCGRRASSGPPRWAPSEVTTRSPSTSAIYQTDVAQQSRAAARGFAPATTFQRMRIDFDEEPVEPVVPADVVMRRGPGDEPFRRDGHSVSTRAFVDHFGFVRRSFEEWHASIESSATHDWAQLLVAYRRRRAGGNGARR